MFALEQVHKLSFRKALKSFNIILFTKKSHLSLLSMSNWLGNILNMLNQLREFRKYKNFISFLRNINIFSRVFLKLLEILSRGQPLPESKIIFSLFGRRKQRKCLVLDSNLMFTSHLGDSGIKCKPISNERQGTSPSKFKPRQQCVRPYPSITG